MVCVVGNDSGWIWLCVVVFVGVGSGCWSICVDRMVVVLELVWCGDFSGFSCCVYVFMWVFSVCFSVGWYLGVNSGNKVVVFGSSVLECVVWILVCRLVLLGIMGCCISCWCISCCLWIFSIGCCRRSSLGLCVGCSILGSLECVLVLDRLRLKILGLCCGCWCWCLGWFGFVLGCLVLWGKGLLR